MSVLAGWAREGAGREEYDRSVASLLDDRCVRCHNAIGQASFRRLDRYELVAAAVRAPSAPSITQQLLVTKVHLAGIGLLLALAIGICWLAGVSTTQIALTTWTGFGGLLVDFGSWWLMRVDLSFAWGRVLGNLLLAVTLVWIAVVALFAMYGRATPKGNQ